MSARPKNAVATAMKNDEFKMINMDNAYTPTAGECVKKRKDEKNGYRFYF